VVKGVTRVAIVVMVMPMAMAMVVIMVMDMGMRVGVDFHVATAETAAAFFAHKNYSTSTPAISNSRPRRRSPLKLRQRGHSFKKSEPANSAWQVGHQHADGTCSMSNTAFSARVPWETTSKANVMDSGTTPLSKPSRSRNFNIRLAPADIAASSAIRNASVMMATSCMLAQ
jgi:hypothetical protein